MEEYSFSEYADMQLTLGEAMGNAAAAVRLYAEKFPNRRPPSRPTFVAVDRR